MANAKFSGRKGFSARWLFLMIAFLVVGIMGARSSGAASATHADETHVFRPFAFWSDPVYTPPEKFALILNVIVAIAGLVYAWMLVKEVYGADTGTSRMKEIAQAVREGADAYLYRQLSTVGISDLTHHGGAHLHQMAIVPTGRSQIQRATANRLGPGHRFLDRGHLLGHRRLRRHASGHGR